MPLCKRDSAHRHYALITLDSRSCERTRGFQIACHFPQHIQRLDEHICLNKSPSFDRKQWIPKKSLWPKLGAKGPQRPAPRSAAPKLTRNRLYFGQPIPNCHRHREGSYLLYGLGDKPSRSASSVPIHFQQFSDLRESVPGIPVRHGWKRSNSALACPRDAHGARRTNQPASW